MIQTTVSRKDIAQVTECVLGGGFRKATKYVSPTLTVTATRRHNPRVSKEARLTEVVLTIGRPNYAARQFIKNCIKAGEPFPVKKIQLKAYPIRMKKAGSARKS